MHLAKLGACTDQRERSAATLAVAMTTLGRASATIARTRSNGRFGRGSGVGTAVTPAARQPRNAVTKSKPGGYKRSARSPSRSELLEPCSKAMRATLQLAKIQMHVRRTIYARAFGK